MGQINLCDNREYEWICRYAQAHTSVERVLHAMTDVVDITGQVQRERRPSTQHVAVTDTKCMLRAEAGGRRGWQRQVAEAPSL